MLRLDAADAATFDDVAVAEAERFAAADAVLRTKLLSMLAYMFECRARYCCKYQTNEAIAKVNNKVVLVLVLWHGLRTTTVRGVVLWREVRTDDGRSVVFAESTDSTHSTPACTASRK